MKIQVYVYARQGAYPDTTYMYNTIRMVVSRQVSHYDIIIIDIINCAIACQDKLS